MAELRAQVADDNEGEDASEWVASEHAQFLPPWRERRPGRRLEDMPWYGPRSAEAFERKMTEFNQSRAGGGLWDEAEDARLRGRATKAEVISVTRPDADDMRAFVERYSHLLTLRELEVYTHYYLDGMSAGNVARALGTVRKTVQNQLQILRKKMRVGSAGNHSESKAAKWEP